MGIGETISNAIGDIISTIARTITSPLQGVYNILQNFTTEVPAPDAGGPNDNVYVFGDITQEPWATVYTQHQQAITIGFLILGIGWIASQALSTYNITSEKGAKQRTNGLIVGTIMLLICWYIAALFLNITQAITDEVILNAFAGTGSSVSGMGTSSSDTVGAALFFVFVQLLGAGIFIIGFLLHAIRIYGIYVLMAILPILVALYYSRVPYLDTLAVKGIKIGIKFAIIGPAVALAYAVIGVVDLATVLGVGGSLGGVLSILSGVIPMLFAVLIPIAVIRTNLAIAGAYGAQGAIDSMKQTDTYQNTVGAATAGAKSRTKGGISKAGSATAGAATTAGGAAKNRAQEALEGPDREGAITGGQENPMEYEESISSGSQAADLMDETGADQQDIAQVADESDVALEPQFDGVEAEAGRDEIIAEAKEARQELEQGRFTTDSPNQDRGINFEGERTQIGGAEEPVYAAHDADAAGVATEDIDPETAQEMVDFLEGGSSYDQFSTTVSTKSSNSSSSDGGGSGGRSSSGGSGSGSIGSGASEADSGNSGPSPVDTSRFTGRDALDSQDTGGKDADYLTTDIFGDTEASGSEDTTTTDSDQLDIDPTDPDRSRRQMEGPDDSINSDDPANDPDHLDIDPIDPDRTREQMEGPDDSVESGDSESEESGSGGSE